MNSTGEIRNKSEQLSETLIFFPYRIMVCKKGFKDIFYQILFKKFFKKIITKLYSIIFIVLQYSNFCHFGILGAPGSSILVGGRREISRPPKTTSGKQHPIFIFDIFKIIGIRNSLNILHWFRILQISASFLIQSDISGLLQGSLAYLSNFNISAADTELINNHEIIFASFLELYIYYLSRFVDC